MLYGTIKTEFEQFKAGEPGYMPFCNVVFFKVAVRTASPACAVVAKRVCFISACCRIAGHARHGRAHCLPARPGDARLPFAPVPQQGRALPWDRTYFQGSAASEASVRLQSL
eukprot:4256708-Pleurochrysis_carterae.AAC.1